MTSTKTPASQKKDKIEFPCLMEFEDGSFVVLFYKDKEGIIIQGKQASFRLGEYVKTWNNINHDCWKKFEGTITLKNDE